MYGDGTASYIELLKEGAQIEISVLSKDRVVGAPRFELGTPSPPDWCANRAALRSELRRTIVSACARGNRAWSGSDTWYPSGVLIRRRRDGADMACSY